MNPIINSNKLKFLTVVLIAVLIFILGAGAATAGWIKIPLVDLSAFLPLVFNRSSPENVTSSSGVLIVFSSTAVTNGDAGGRSGMNNICASQDPFSHFCSLPEIEAAWMYRGVRFQSPFARSWVDNPFLGTVIAHQATGAATGSKWQANDVCGGWRSDAPNGTWIEESAVGINIEIAPGYPVIASCSNTYPVACCR